MIPKQAICNCKLKYVWYKLEKMLSIIFYVLAAEPIDQQDNVATLKGLEGLFANIVAAVLEISAIAVFIMLLIGGFKYITSGGDPQAAEAAKKSITYAIGGLVLVASAYLILSLIHEITYAGILNFIVERP